jgi:hypothetical protein
MTGRSGPVRHRGTGPESAADGRRRRFGRGGGASPRHPLLEAQTRDPRRPGGAESTAGKPVDALIANQLGRALYSELFADARGPANWARFVFLDPRARDLYVDWEGSAKDVVALLRTQAGRNPHDRKLSDLVGELSTASEEFRGQWAAHDVRLHTKGVKHFNHPIVGELELSYNRLEVSADPGLTLVVYTAEPGSHSAEQFSLLASWVATEPTAGTRLSAPEH